jgi:uncharacterized membrane protein HdeD (DUF308 family)
MPGANQGVVMARWILFAVSVVVALIGVVWILQGVGVITGSFMTGQKLWFLIGVGALLVGVVVAAATLQRPKRDPDKADKAGKAE